MGEGQKKRILVIRPDRIGDVILSTPVFEALKSEISDVHLTVMVQENLLPLLKDHPFVDDWMILKPKAEHQGVDGCFRLANAIRRRNFDAAVVLQSNFNIGLALFLAGVPIRIGPYSKLHSYFFYNSGLKQNRSAVEMHETEYNLELLGKLGISKERIEIAKKKYPTRISIADATLTEANEWLLENGCDFKKKRVLVHPGMGGSARNWPQRSYLELVKQLMTAGYQVIVTAGPTDLEVIQTFGKLRRPVIFYQAAKNSQIDFLAALCYLSNLVIAPSTGPLHMAVAVGKPVVTIYPPIRVQRPKRWGPYFAAEHGETKGKVLVPSVECGQAFHCIGKKCPYYDCMDKISVAEVFEEVKKRV